MGRARRTGNTPPHPFNKLPNWEGDGARTCQPTNRSLGTILKALSVSSLDHRHSLGHMFCPCFSSFYTTLRRPKSSVFCALVHVCYLLSATTFLSRQVSATSTFPMSLKDGWDHGTQPRSRPHSDRNRDTANSENGPAIRDTPLQMPN